VTCVSLSEALDRMSPLILVVRDPRGTISVTLHGARHGSSAHWRLGRPSRRRVTILGMSAVVSAGG
jgi:hypothetical protein